MHNWHDPSYLQHGTLQQQQACQVLQALEVKRRLAAYEPVLTGTVPLDIDVPGSDLDIICAVPLAAQPAFAQLLRAHYGHLPGFSLRRGLVGGLESVVSNFYCEGLPIEVFGQGLPTRQQNAYRHLLVEHAVLQTGGEAWRLAVRALKQQGLKTEPAFARLLRLPNHSPYQALLQLEKLPPAALTALVAGCPLPPGQ
ncbi:MAG: DUF4269 domain-containing protein [Hymenobacter sp.]|nr:MAG: DUF4269 domain-containing protein [Hymenobacter sp.]